MPRILLIDDDENYTFALSSLLKRGGHEVGVAHDAVAALNEVKTGIYDVAFLDLRLGDADGLTLIVQLASVNPMLPIICLTGVEDTTAVVQAMRKGAADYLTKPVDKATLFD
ncbi:MAG: response regulator, partial [Archangium sp.]